MKASWPRGSTGSRSAPPPRRSSQSLVKTTQDELKAQGVTDPAKQYDVVTVASIVQAEGGQAEYKDVAGAIYNRLKPNNTETAGLIQSDATVTYGLGRKSFHITEEEKAGQVQPVQHVRQPGTARQVPSVRRARRPSMPRPSRTRMITCTG